MSIPADAFFKRAKAAFVYASVPLMVLGILVARESYQASLVLLLISSYGFALAAIESSEGHGLALAFVMTLLGVALLFAYQSDIDRRAGRAYRAHRDVIGCRDADAWIATDKKYTPSGKEPSAADIRRCADEDEYTAREFKAALRVQDW